MLASKALVPGISSDGAVQRAYTAALQATLAVLAAHGLRVKSTANDALAAIRTSIITALPGLANRLAPIR